MNNVDVQGFFSKPSRRVPKLVQVHLNSEEIDDASMDFENPINLLMKSYFDIYYVML